MAQIPRTIIAFILFLFIVSCGVKGDPLPPEKPAEIGRGRPTYKRATEPLRPSDLPPMYENDMNEDKEEEE